MSWPVHALTAALTLRSRSWAVASAVAPTSRSRATSLMETPAVSSCIEARVSALEVQRNLRKPLKRRHKIGYSKACSILRGEAFLAGHRDCHEYRHSVASPVGRCISVAAARHHRSAPEQVAWMLRSQP